MSKKNYFKTMCIFAIVFVISIVMAVITLSPKKVAYADSLDGANACTGIRVKGEQESTIWNSMLYLNLQSCAVLDGQESIIFQLNSRVTSGNCRLVFGVFDTLGNWYEFMGKSNCSGSYKKADSIEGLKNATLRSAGQWESFNQLNVNGEIFYELPFKNFYTRGNFDQIYIDGTSKNLANATESGSELKTSKKLYGVFVRFVDQEIKNADIIFENVYTKNNTGSVTKICDTYELTPSNNDLSYSIDNGTFWCGSVQGTEYDASGKATSLGWMQPVDRRSLLVSIQKYVATQKVLPQAGRLDGVLFSINDTDSENYKYVYINGSTEKINNSNYISVRIADHHNAENKFQFFMYTSEKNNSNRAGIYQNKPVYLFNKDGSFISQITTLNEWSWVAIPASFDGYMVVSFDSIEWSIDKTKAVVAGFVSQGLQLISNQQQGTLSTEKSRGLSLEVGEISLIQGSLNSANDNFNSLEKVSYAKTLTDDRYNYTANVSANDLSCISAVTGTDMEYSYSFVDGVVFDAKEGAGSGTIKLNGINNGYLSLYTINETINDLKVVLSYGNNFVSSAKLISSFDETFNYSSLTNGELTIPGSFEGYILIPYSSEESLSVTLDKGERFVLKTVGSVASNSYNTIDGVFANNNHYFVPLVSTDTTLKNLLTVSNGVTLKRTVKSVYFTNDVPEGTTAGEMANVTILTEDIYVLDIQDDLPIYKCYKPEDIVPTFMYASMPSLLKTSGNKYIMGDKGQNIKLKATSAGIIYVVANKDFSADGFTKVMVCDSFLEGIDEKLFIYKKDLSENQEVTVQGHYVLVVKAKSDFVLTETQPYIYYLDDIPSQYYAENNVFFGCVGGSTILSNGRTFVGTMSGGRTEPVVENVSYVLISDSIKDAPISYMVIDHPYSSNVRVMEPSLIYNKEMNRLVLFFVTSSGDSVNNSVFWAMYTDNPDAEDIKDICWSKPIMLCKGVFSSKPSMLSNGKYILTTTDVTKPIINILLFDINKIEIEEIAEIQTQSTAVFPETSFIEKNDGSLWMLIRNVGSNEYNYITEFFSNDGGVTWSAGSVNHDLFNSNSNFYIMRMPSGNLVYIGNASDNRSEMTAKLSTDDGKTWAYSLLLDKRDWVSYPKAVVLPTGEIVVVYDKGRVVEKEIRYAIFTEQDIIDGAFNSENSVQYGIYIKANPNYLELTQMETDIQKVCPAGTTADEILSQLDKNIIVKDNMGKSYNLTGTWVVESAVDDKEYVNFVFMPSTSLPSNVTDLQDILKVKVLIQKLQVSSISIISKPTKLIYKVGEKLDLTGVSVKVFYNNDISVFLQSTDYTVSGFSSEQAGTYTITVSYGDYTDSFDITVEGAASDNKTNSSGCNGCNGQIDVGSMLLSILALTTCAFVICLKRKKR